MSIFRKIPCIERKPNETEFEWYDTDCGHLLYRLSQDKFTNESALEEFPEWWLEEISEYNFNQFELQLRIEKEKYNL